MREGRNGTGYVRYTQDKDAIVAGEEDADSSTYNEEVYLLHYQKQKANFAKDREKQQKIAKAKQDYEDVIVSLFANPLGKELLTELRVFRKGGEKHIGEYNIDSASYGDMYLLCNLQNILSLMQHYLVKPQFSGMLTHPDPYIYIDPIVQKYQDRIYHTIDTGE